MQEQGKVAAEAHGVPRLALQSGSWLDVEGGQQKHQEEKGRPAQLNPQQDG